MFQKRNGPSKKAAQHSGKNHPFIKGSKLIPLPGQTREFLHKVIVDLRIKNFVFSNNWTLFKTKIAQRCY